MRLTFLALTLMALPVSAVEIIAHRGASYDAPENTLSSVKLAWEQNTDSVEIDVYLSKDGRIVLFHDKETDRIGGRKKKIIDQTYEELQQLDVGAWKDLKYAGEKMPTLEEILPTIPDGKRLYVEIKHDASILRELKKSFAKAGVDGEKITIIAFDCDVIVGTKKLMPSIPAYWLSSIKQDKQTGEWGPPREELIAKAKAAGVEGLDLQAQPVIDADYVKAVKDAGLEFYVWTVNDPAEAKRLVEAGVDGITTDRPGWMKEQLGLAK
ncbi:MAG: glycerophosphodiester phosphodiesterase [Planctomycetota bacterium]|nr:glycerophosphodiester phosphodiesterase [Planctomycetaceae bacterium]MDQ3330853.1 glycerophosphodiester phosphodiesterase [Planctomycetota bacterium]